jgi:hypothetical protein
MSAIKGVKFVVDFFRGTTAFVEPEAEALEQAGVDRDRYVAAHRRLVNIARIFAILGFVLWTFAFVAGSLIVGMKFNDPGKIAIVCLSPFLGCILGAAVGAILGCLIAPRDFLLGPLGRKWMSFIGTQNVLAARVVCFICFILVGYFFVAMSLLLVASSMNLYPPALFRGEIVYMDEKGLPIKK